MSAGSDAAELERCMAVCLSAAEIGALATQLGVPVAPGGSMARAAHEVVKAMDRGGRMGDLLATLRQAKPLVEWPEPRPAGEDEPVELSGEALVDDFAPTFAQQEPAPGLFGATAEPPPSSRRAPASFAPEPGPGLSPFDLPMGTGRAPPASAATWPGPRPEPRGRSGVVLVGAACVLVAGVAVAFAAGRLSSSEASTPVPATGPTVVATTAPQRPDGPALRAANALGRSLSNVSRACELRGVAPGEVLEAAYAECGAARVGRRPIRERPAGAEPEPAATANGTAAPVTGAAPRAADPAVPAFPAGPCLASCEARHSECRTACGPEPQLATEYAAHQQCLARCLASASKCRLVCE